MQSWVVRGDGIKRKTIAQEERRIFSKKLGAAPAQLGRLPSLSKARKFREIPASQMAEGVSVIVFLVVYREKNCYSCKHKLTFNIYCNYHLCFCLSNTWFNLVKN